MLSVRTNSARNILVQALTARRPSCSRSVMTLKDVKYTAHATAQGQGRNGQVKSDDDVGLELRLAMPKSLGGKGDGNNPEQLFAMGYAACFLSAMQVQANRLGKTDMAKNAVVHTQVHIGEPADIGGFGLSVDITVDNVDEELLQAGHELCPYSRAVRHGAVVNVSRGSGGGGQRSEGASGGDTNPGTGRARTGAEGENHASGYSR